jgi:hypothetical protein
VAFYSELPSPPLQLEFYLKVYTSENEKNQVFFSGTDEEIEFADIIIPTTKLSRS